MPTENFFFGYIRYLTCRGIVSGYADGYFRPNNPITRAEFSKMVTLAFSIPRTTPAVRSFSDVPTNYWAYGYIESLTAAGVINGQNAAQCAAAGVAAPCFRPNNPISRAELVKMVVVASGTAAQTSTTAYPDVPPSYWAYSYIQTATARQWVGGFPDNSFRPNALATRAELSKVVYLALNFPLGVSR